MKEKIISLISREEKDYLLFERHTPFKFEVAQHMNVQIIGVPSQMDLNKRVLHLLQGVQPNLTFVTEEADPYRKLKEDAKGHFLYFETVSMRTARGVKSAGVFAQVQQTDKVDLRLGRAIACQVLNEREKIEWKTCQLDRQAEDATVQRLRDKFNL